MARGYRRQVVILTAVFAALVVSWSLTMRLAGRPTSQPAESGEFSAPSVLVDVASVTVGPITHSISAVGTLQAVASVMIRPEVPGLVRRVRFADGQAVEQGAVLIELDQEELQAQAAQATAQEQIARLTYNRLKRLSGQQTTIVPPQQLDEVRMTLQAAEANTILYTTRLKKTTIRAPFSGVVGLRRISAGDYVQPGQDLVNLEDLRMLHVDFKVPEVWLSRLATRQHLHLVTDAFPDQVFPGEVSAIDPRIDVVNRTVSVRAAVPNPDGRLRPGLFATVHLTLGQQPDALLIPEEAVFLQQDKTFVFRIEDAMVHLTEVQLGLRERGLVQILSGLAAGNRVVRTGQHKLNDGTWVLVKPS